MKKRIIAVFTGNRAEYGLQVPILRAIDMHPKLEYRLIVSGAHLDKNFGQTIKEIESDGFKISAEVKINMKKDNLFSTAQAIGNCVKETSKVLERINPNIFVVYADRFEGFAATVAGTQMSIPTAHIEGGDITEGGALDDSVRHAMTKLAHLHFTTNKEATRRIKTMGEESWRIHTVGFPAIDLIKNNEFTDKNTLIKKYKLSTKKPILLVTQHSVATEFKDATSQIKPTLDAVIELAKKGFQFIFSYPNNDAGGKLIISQLEKLKKKKIENVQIYKHLGRNDYYGMMNLFKKIPGVCLGNSSSGIKETPAFNIPSIDIGSRQKNRLSAKNIIKVNYNKIEIIKAIKKATSEKFRNYCKKIKNPYGIGSSGLKIAKILSKVKIDKKLIQKKMTIKF